MSLGTFLENSATALKKNAGRAILPLAIGLSSLLSPAEAFSQYNSGYKEKKQKYGGETPDLLAFDVGFNHKGQFAFGGTANIIKDYVFVNASSTLTNAKIGSSGSVNFPGYSKTSYGFKHQFSRANFGVLAGKKIEFNKEDAKSFMIVGMEADAMVFPGGYNNWLNFADVYAGPTVHFFTGVRLPQRARQERAQSDVQIQELKAAKRSLGVSLKLKARKMVVENGSFWDDLLERNFNAGIDDIYPNRRRELGAEAILSLAYRFN